MPQQSQRPLDLFDTLSVRIRQMGDEYFRSDAAPYAEIKEAQLPPGFELVLRTNTPSHSKLASAYMLVAHPKDGREHHLGDVWVRYPPGYRNPSVWRDAVAFGFRTLAYYHRNGQSTIYMVTVDLAEAGYQLR